MPFDISRIATPIVSPLASGTSSPSSTGGTDTVKQSADASDVFGLTKDDFFKLFLNQLKNQDPTAPMDDKDMLPLKISVSDDSLDKVRVLGSYLAEHKKGSCGVVLLEKVENNRKRMWQSGLGR